MQKTLKSITQFYYYIYSATILTTLGGYIVNMSRDVSYGPKDPLNIALSSIVILYLLISIPLALGLFFKKTKKWSLIEDENLKYTSYEKGAKLRLLAIGIGLLASIIVFYILRSNISLIYCAGIGAIALLFCKPTQSKINSDLHLEESEE
jgi:hypothetical protein